MTWRRAVAFLSAEVVLILCWRAGPLTPRESFVCVSLCVLQALISTGRI